METFARIAALRGAAWLIAVALSAGCAQPATRSDTPAASPWAAPTSTVRWNEYACELIARNAGYADLVNAYDKVEREDEEVSA